MFIQMLKKDLQMKSGGMGSSTPQWSEAKRGVLLTARTTVD